MVEIYPAYFMRFMTAGNRQAVIDFHEKTDVNVAMTRASVAPGDSMYIDIEYPGRKQVYIPGIEPGFFRDFL